MRKCSLFLFAVYLGVLLLGSILFLNEKEVNSLTYRDVDLFLSSYTPNYPNIQVLGAYNRGNTLSDPSNVALTASEDVLFGEYTEKESFIGEITGYASLDPRAEEGVCYSGDPSITASGDKVGRGVAAANFLEFGTKFMIPELFDDEVFIVKDRMANSYGWGNIDIWFRNQDDAVDLGRVSAEVIIVE